MLHLFKKVYIEVDSKLDLSVDRVVISSKYGIPTASELNGMVTGSCLAYGLTLREVLAGATVEDLLLVLAAHTNKTNKPIVMYVDKDTFLTVITIWYKIILKSATAADVFKLLKSYFYV